MSAPTDEIQGKIRNLPFGVRVFSVFVRAFHLLGAAAVVGAGITAGSDPKSMWIWWELALYSGAALFVLEAAKHVEFYRELNGWSTFIKCGFIVAALLFSGARSPLLVTAFLIAVLGEPISRAAGGRKGCSDS